MGIKPVQRQQCTVAADDRLQAGAELFRRHPAIFDVVSHRPYKLFVASHFEADGLLDPERVRNELLLSLGRFHFLCLPGQPDDDKQEKQNQYDRYQPEPGLPVCRFQEACHGRNT